MKYILILTFFCLFISSCFVKKEKTFIKDVVSYGKFENIPYDTTFLLNEYRVTREKQYLFDSSVVLLNYVFFYDQMILENKINDTLLNNYYSRIEFKEKSIRLVDLFNENKIFNWEISCFMKNEGYYKYLISEFCGACHEVHSDTLIITKNTAYIDPPLSRM